jgi:hypothetical protein
VSAYETLLALDRTASPAPWERRNASNLAGDGPVIAPVGSFDWVATVQVSNVSEWRENAVLLISLRNALPQIAAVVEAASDPCLFDYDKVGEEKQEALRAALAALKKEMS